MQDKINVDICVATYKRPELLEQLLNSLFRQVIDQRMSYKIIVVDNDKHTSADSVVRRLRSNSPVDIIYDVEPKQNIAHARNKAISHVVGDYFIFIDDDEQAKSDWLNNHIKTVEQYKADVVFGPVIPIYPENSPEWIKTGGFFDRVRYPTGTIRPHGPTSNTLVKTKILEKMNYLFDEKYGLTGGEDTDFFWRMGKIGAKMIWCDNALVEETVPFNRMTVKWLTRRAYTGGQNYTRVFYRDMNRTQKIFWILKRTSFLLIAFANLTFCYLQGKVKRVKAQRKFYSCLGRLTGFTSFIYKEYSQ